MKPEPEIQKEKHFIRARDFSSMNKKRGERRHWNGFQAAEGSKEKEEEEGSFKGREGAFI